MTVGSSGPGGAAELLETLRRWEEAGATWAVLSRTSSLATVSLLSCDGGEEVDRITTDDPEALAFLRDR